MFDKNEIKQSLKQGVKKVTFTKADGSQRVLNCTLQESVLPAVGTTATNTKKQNDEVLAVWDVDNAGWRSFRFDSIISVQ